VLQTVKNQWPAVLALLFSLLLSLLYTETALAVDGNRYRAELVLVERLDSEQDLGERMQSRRPSTPEEIEKTLLAISDSGQAYSDIDLVPTNELYLSSAISRLKNSGRFRILLAAGWYENFPPNYQGERMGVAVGDLLATTEAQASAEPREAQREIEGFISIDRQRYLHVTARLNHWEKTPADETDSENALAAEDAQTAVTASPADSSLNNKRTEQATATDPESIENQAQGAQAPATTDNQPAQKPPLQLKTWLHETRRMRSEEIHYLDSPTIGLLVYFEPVEPVEKESDTSEQSDSPDSLAEGTDEPTDAGAQ
jgi:hypothetical protein